MPFIIKNHESTSEKAGNKIFVKLTPGKEVGLITSKDILGFGGEKKNEGERFRGDGISAQTMENNQTSQEKSKNINKIERLEQY